MFVLGTNNLVSDPLGLEKHLENLLKVGIMLVASRTVRYVAFVEVFHPFGPGSL